MQSTVALTAQYTVTSENIGWLSFHCGWWCISRLCFVYLYVFSLIAVCWSLRFLVVKFSKTNSLTAMFWGVNIVHLGEKREGVLDRLYVSADIIWVEVLEPVSAEKMLKCCNFPLYEWISLDFQKKKLGIQKKIKPRYNLVDIWPSSIKSSLLWSPCRWLCVHSQVLAWYHALRDK